MHLRILPDHQQLFFNKDVFERREWLKRCFMHLRILPDHQNLFFNKEVFEHLEWSKRCFDAFTHTSRQTEKCSGKRYFLLSGVVKNVF
jgi:hypothetical protein